MVVRVTSHTEGCVFDPWVLPCPQPLMVGGRRATNLIKREDLKITAKEQALKTGDTRWDLDNSKPGEASWEYQLCRCHTNRRFKRNKRSEENRDANAARNIAFVFWWLRTHGGVRPPGFRRTVVDGGGGGGEEERKPSPDDSPS